jgi:D-lactate dehydrogenase (cytochrome)
MTLIHTLRSRRPRGELQPPSAITDPDLIAPRLEDAAHYPGGHAPVLYVPRGEAEIAAVLRESGSLLAVGAQSSLTGGATPMGDRLLSTERLNRCVDISTERVRVQAGVSLSALAATLHARALYYPPAPTFDGALLGGTIATNAAGAATFKHGTTREWVEAVTVVLATGDVLDIERGVTHAHADGYFDLQLANGAVQVEVPAITMPNVPKLSAGYFGRPGMDLIDLFIGSEGTLGVIVEATLRVIPRPAQALALVTFDDERPGLACVRQLRDESLATRRSSVRGGLDISAIEHMDARCLAVLRAAGADRRAGVEIPADAMLAILVTIDLPAGYTAARAYEEIAAVDSSGGERTPLGRFCSVLDAHNAVAATQIAVPGDLTLAKQLVGLREAVPAAVNERIGRLKTTVDRGIQKVAADVIVPFEQIERLIAFCGEAFAARALDGAVWGHISDGNLHPNVIPQSSDAVAKGQEAVLAIGREAMRLGGAPLAEHGVGRNPVKQQLLREMYGDSGIASMRRIKTALDPEWKLAPGVLFAR